MSNDNDTFIDADKPMAIIYCFNINQVDKESDSLQDAFCHFKSIKIDFSESATENHQESDTGADHNSALEIGKERNNIEKLTSLLSKLDKNEFAVEILYFKNYKNTEDTKQLDSLIECFKDTKLTQMTHSNSILSNDAITILTEMLIHNNMLENQSEDMFNLSNDV